MLVLGIIICASAVSVVVLIGCIIVCRRRLIQRQEEELKKAEQREYQRRKNKAKVVPLSVDGQNNNLKTEGVASLPKNGLNFIEVDEDGHMVKVQPNNNIKLQTDQSIATKKDGDNVSIDRFSMIMSMYNDKNRRTNNCFEDTIDAKQKVQLGQIAGEGTANNSSF